MMKKLQYFSARNLLTLYLSGVVAVVFLTLHWSDRLLTWIKTDHLLECLESYSVALLADH